MAKVQKMPVKAQEAPETGDKLSDREVGLLRENEALKALLKAVAADLLALRDYVVKALG